MQLYFKGFGLLCKLICHETRSFSKTLLKSRKNLKTPDCHFLMDGKHFKSRIFPKRWTHDNHVISLSEFSWNTNPKQPVIVGFLNSRSVNRKHLMRFQIESSVFSSSCLADGTLVKFRRTMNTIDLFRSPLLGACNSHNKPMQRHFCRPVYF